MSYDVTKDRQEVITVAIRVYIDQGHNPEGPNSGATGNGLREQDITYRVGEALYRRLEADPNYVAELSRPTIDTTLGVSNGGSLRARVEGAEAFGADLFLSIHTNAAVNPQATGVEALIYRLGTPIEDLAEDIIEEISDLTGLRERDVLARPGLYVLRETSMPAVLVEIGFISNPQDAAIMRDNPDLFAEGIYRALNDYYGF